MKRWLSAMRLRTLPLAASCILAGSAAGWSNSSNPWAILFWGLLTTFLLQILSNLANDYGDFEKGTDNDERVGPKRAMQSGAISKKEMQVALAVMTMACLISGLMLLHTALTPRGMLLQGVLFLAVGLLAILAAFRYTIGANPYGYRGLGDLFVFIFFGIVGVFGINYLHTGMWDLHCIFPAMTIGLFSTGVLNLNNLRDHVNDAASGKHTLVVQLGFSRAKLYHIMLITAGVICGLIWIFNTSGLLARLSALPLLLQLILAVKTFKTIDPARLDPELKKVAMLTFATSFLWFLNAVNI